MPVYDRANSSLWRMEELSVKPTKMPTAPWYSAPTWVMTFFSTTLFDVRRAAGVPVDQRLEHGHDHRRRRQVLARSGFVEQVARRLIEVPFAGLVEELVGIFNPEQRVRPPAAAW